MSTTIIDTTRLEPLWTSVSRRNLLDWALAKAARKAIAAFAAYRAFRRAESELMALDDRTLKDMGLDRSEIGSALMDHAQERRNGVRQCLEQTPRFRSSALSRSPHRTR